MKINSKFIILSLLALAIVLGVFYVIYKGFPAGQSIVTELTQDGVSINGDLSDEQAKEAIDIILESLLTMHYVSLRDIEISDSDSFIIEELTESLNDKAKLQQVIYKTEDLTDSQNQTVGVTAFAIRTSAIILISAYDSWIEYLRGVDAYSVDVSEFQYQLASFQSNIHQSYLTLAEGVALFPGIAIIFAENSDDNSINSELRDYLLERINDLFDDILVDNKKFRAETGSQYAIAVVINGYKDFLIGETQ